MTPGLSSDPNEIDDARKTAVINSELFRLNVDIAALQETRLAELGTLRERDYTFVWKGKGADEVREHGVGFAIKNSLMQMAEPGEDGTERIYTLRLHTTDRACDLCLCLRPYPLLIARCQRGILRSTPDSHS